MCRVDSPFPYTGVGTSLYIAPETLAPSRQDRGVKRVPSNKIDSKLLLPLSVFDP